VKPDTSAHGYLFPCLKKIIDGLALKRDISILDAGCGGGAFLDYLHRVGFKNSWGFDSSSKGIEIAKKNFPEISDKFFIHNCYDENLPNLPIGNKFQLIISMEVIEHLYNPDSYIKNLYNWLDSSAYLILTTPYHGYLKNFFIAFLNRFDKHVDPLCEGGHIKFFSKKNLYRLFEETKIKPIGFYGSGRLPFLWKSMVVVGKKSE
jgi:2-polyprenyl-3-methyl-5-hydroxy-6-metoxy-1,4-benzoquinol methylase